MYYLKKAIVDEQIVLVMMFSSYVNIVICIVYEACKIEKDIRKRDH